MKLIGNLKKQVENESTREGRREAIRKAGMLLTDDELEKVAGGVEEEPIYLFMCKDTEGCKHRFLTNDRENLCCPRCGGPVEEITNL